MAGQDTPAPALKEMFNTARYRTVADALASLDRHFDSRRFLELALRDLDSLSLTARLRRLTESLHAVLEDRSYPEIIALLKQLAPKLEQGFTTLFLPDYVSLHGHAPEHFEISLEALKFFTPFGSSEFAIREFLKRGLHRTLAVMREWSTDPDEHVRRLASEGCRPRLPWSFHLPLLAADPGLAAPILENLRADPSLYVRKSVANHLNDHTRARPDWVIERLSAWPREDARTAWIIRHALRTLIKQGYPPALALIGASGPAEAVVEDLQALPGRLKLGGRLTLSFRLRSTGRQTQRLVADYRIHYVRKGGAARSAKVFKLKEVTLEPGASLTLGRSQVIRDFTTRRHTPGRHTVEILLNGKVHGTTSFDLVL